MAFPVNTTVSVIQLLRKKHHVLGIRLQHSECLGVLSFECFLSSHYVKTLEALGGRIVIWLILPVVIRLSQRLSHACLSISNYTVKLRMAHYISYSLFDSTLLLG